MNIEKDAMTMKNDRLLFPSEIDSFAPLSFVWSQRREKWILGRRQAGNFPSPSPYYSPSEVGINEPKTNEREKRRWEKRVSQCAYLLALFSRTLDIKNERERTNYTWKRSHFPIDLKRKDITMEQPAVFKAIREFSISHLNSSIKEQYMDGKRQRTFAESSNSPVTDLFVGLTLSPYAVCQEKEEKKEWKHFPFWYSLKYLLLPLSLPSFPPFSPILYASRM